MLDFNWLGLKIPRSNARKYYATVRILRQELLNVVLLISTVKLGENNAWDACDSFSENAPISGAKWGQVTISPYIL